MELLNEKYEDKVLGTIGCYDRVIIMGTLPGLCYPDGMTCHLNHHGVRIFDYPKFAQFYRDIIRENTKNLACANGIKIHHIRSPKKDKGKLIKDKLTKLKKKGKVVEGLFYIISCQEMCSCYKPSYDEKKGECYLERDWCPCIHYYFYFIDKDLGLCHVRVPTWLPCRLQIYFNGHNWLASQL
ncbi:MAG: MarR family transcriptional regulator, partial [Candidatus Aminicenantes bacterium]|nr:MarR family transcriptional regulator [Candidatus Aminicenantes bacterium]